MLILHSAPQLNPLSGYLEQSTELLWPNRADAGLELYCKYLISIMKFPEIFFLVFWLEI